MSVKVFEYDTKTYVVPTDVLNNRLKATCSLQEFQKMLEPNHRWNIFRHSQSSILRKSSRTS